MDGSLSIQLAPTVTATATQPPTPTPTPTVAANQVNIQCRRDQHTVLSRVVRDSLSEMVRCHDRRMQGKQSAATDCNDRDNAISPDRIAREEDKLRRRLDNACAGSRRAEAASPAAMGYLSCPAPCDAVEIANSYRGQADCLLCLAKEHSEALAAAVYGTPPSPVSRDEGSCQTRIARGTRAYLMARLTAQRRCQLSQDRGSESAATDCKAYDPRGRVARARGTLMNRIDRCTAGALGTLDGCGADRATTDACTAAAAEAVTDALFDAVYPVLAPF